MAATNVSLPVILRGPDRWVWGSRERAPLTLGPGVIARPFRPSVVLSLMAYVDIHRAWIKQP